MRKCSIAILLLVAFVRPPVSFMQTADVFSDVYPEAPIITHVGIVVPNIMVAASQYMKVFGIAPFVGRVSIPMPDGTTADVNRAYFWYPNFRIEVYEPLNKNGPFYEHLQKYGPGVQHFGILPRGNEVAYREALAKKGGRCLLGRNLAGCYYFDFSGRLGFDLEILGEYTGGIAEMDQGMQWTTSNRRVLGGSSARHVGIVVQDLDKSMKTFEDLVGLRPQPAKRVPPSPQLFPFPPGHQWNADAHVMSAMLMGRAYPEGTIGVELIQPVGEASPWSQTLRQQHRDAVQHLAFSHGLMTREEWLRAGQANGGKWVAGGPAPTDAKATYPDAANNMFALLDFSDTLGVMLEW